MNSGTLCCVWTRNGNQVGHECASSISVTVHCMRCAANGFCSINRPSLISIINRMIGQCHIERLLAKKNDRAMDRGKKQDVNEILMSLPRQWLQSMDFPSRHSEELCLGAVLDVRKEDATNEISGYISIADQRNTNMQWDTPQRRDEYRKKQIDRHKYCDKSSCLWADWLEVWWRETRPYNNNKQTIEDSLTNDNKHNLVPSGPNNNVRTVHLHTEYKNNARLDCALLNSCLIYWDSHGKGQGIVKQGGKVIFINN